MCLISKGLASCILIALFVNPASVQADVFKGTVLAVFPEQQSIIIADDVTGEWTVYLDRQGKVFIDEIAAKFSDLLPGEYVTVTYQNQGDRVVATEIRCRRDGENCAGNVCGRN